MAGWRDNLTFKNEILWYYHSNETPDRIFVQNLLSHRNFGKKSFRLHTENKRKAKSL